MFDIIRFLEENDIRASSSGKNTSRGWINIQCPYCGDSSNHLGINIKTGIFNCWVCGTTGRPEKLIQELLDVSWSEAKNLANQYSTDELGIEPQKTYQHHPIKLPQIFTKDFPQIYIDYLKKRNFEPQKVIQKYALETCLNVSKYKYRIIAPIVLEGSTVNFTARDITDKRPPKYLNMDNEEAGIPIKHCLYNLDTVKKQIIIFEGITSVWRFGEGTVATFGEMYSQEQVAILAYRGIKEAFIMYDGEEDAIRQAYKLGNDLSAIIPHVAVLELDTGDPADNFSDEEASDFKRRLFNG